MYLSSGKFVRAEKFVRAREFVRRARARVPGTLRRARKRGSLRSHEKRILGFHSTWVEKPMLAAVDAVETAAEEVGVAEEAEAEVPTPPYQGRHLK